MMQSNKCNKLIIGITGPTGSGKSYICNLFENLGAKIISADKIGHEVLINEAKEQILKYFRTLERKEIGHIVFKDKEKLKKLNDIMHPLIVNKILNIIKDESFVVIDAALLFEVGLHKYCTETIYVLANKNARLLRIIERDKITKLQAEARIENEPSSIPNVNIVIYNDFEKN